MADSACVGMCPICDDDDDPTNKRPALNVAAAAAAGVAYDATTPQSPPADSTDTASDGDTPSPSQRRCEYGWNTWDSIPEYLKDNHFVQTGYRVDLGWRNSIISLFQFHNETLNVWTHLCGFVVVTALLISTVVSLSPYGLDRLEIAPVTINTTTDAAGTITIPPLNSAATAGSSKRSPAAGTAASSESSRSLLDRLMSSPELLSAAFERVNSDVLPGVSRVTNTLRSKASRLADDAAERFTAYMLSIEREMEELRRIAADPNPLPRFKELLLHQYDDFGHYVQQTEIDLVAYSHYLVDQFTVRGGTALQLLIPVPDSNGHTLTECRAATAAAAAFNGSVNGTSDGSGLVCTRLVSHLPVWPISIFMLSAMSCLLFSTIYHLFSSHSAYIAAAFQRLDYAGICLLIAGSNVPVMYYGFTCQPYWRALYLSICGALGIGCFIVTTTEKYLHPRYRVLRTAAFVSMGVSGVIPAFHLLLNGMDSIILDLLTMGATYLLGAIIYVFRIPERWKPGQFDIFFNSHQLWHCFVAAAIMLHYAAVLRFFQWRQLNDCPIH